MRTRLPLPLRTVPGPRRLAARLQRPTPQNLREQARALVTHPLVGQALELGRRASVLSRRSTLSVLSHRSTGSVFSAWSVFSAGSVGSACSAGSFLSVGSAGSILSIASSGSILSIASSGSTLSIGGSGAFLGQAASPADDSGEQEASADPASIQRISQLIALAALLAAARRSVA